MSGDRWVALAILVMVTVSIVSFTQGMRFVKHETDIARSKGIKVGIDRALKYMGSIDKHRQDTDAQ